MRATHALIGPFLLLCASAQAQTRLPWKDATPTPPAIAAAPDFEKAVMPPVMVTLPGMDDVRIWREIDYARSADPFVRMDVYAPKNRPRKPQPAVLFIHGGVSTKGQAKDWGLYQSWGRLAAASGLVGVTFTHRLGFPKTQVNEGAADVAAAIAYVRANAAEYGIDAERLCLVAFSAGGPMLTPYLSGAPDYFRCAVSMYTFLDIRQTKEHQQESPETRDAFSPILKVGGGGRKTPLLVVRAGKDEIPTLLDSVDRFVAEALRADYPVTLLNVPDAPHGFDNQEPTPRREEAIKSILWFVRHQLAPRR